jgi:hypothetical protein
VRTLCLGEALVDLVCEQPVSGIAEADAFRPHFGGAMANVCVAAARHGGAVALAGGAGVVALAGLLGMCPLHANSPREAVVRCAPGRSSPAGTWASRSSCRLCRRSGRSRGS